MREVVPIIDLFAGPGGLGEGFAAYEAPERLRRCFRILLSIEKDAHAHRTLELRSFFRQFVTKPVPDDYYSYIQGKLSRDELFAKHPFQAASAAREARLAELGKDNRQIYRYIQSALKPYRGKQWVLIGGPPCQAYSVIGRPRIRAAKAKKGEDFDQDERHFLYKEYLRILALFQPSVFVMENVKGLLSSKINNQSMFTRILDDLRNPASVAPLSENIAPPRYVIYSLVVEKSPDELTPNDFIIRSEKYGVPQSRHRLFLLGIRTDLDVTPDILEEKHVQAGVGQVIGDLPPLRSCLSRQKDNSESWREVILSVLTREWLLDLGKQENDLFSIPLQEEIRKSACAAGVYSDTGGEFVDTPADPRYLRGWFHDVRLGGVSNHVARSHMGDDLHRYLFATCFARVYAVSPKLIDYPDELLPEHKNVAIDKEIFDDRFRVQVEGRPASTIVSHIAKDGHYNIHYDPIQCRSLTVREAARLQTFPDNYFFEGPRTKQYQQVGNAVPPYLALQIAGVVYGLCKQIS